MVAVGAKDFPSFAVYTGGTLPTLVEVAAGRQKLGDTKAQDARFEVTAGTSYSIRASNADGGDVAVGWEPFINPPNDNFSSPTQIPWAPSGSIAGTTWGATSQPGEPAHAGSPAGSSAWWTITPPNSGVVNLTVEDDSCSTRFGVYTGTSLPALSPISAASGCQGLGEPPSARFAVTAGVTYRIAVDSNPESNVQLRWGFGPRAANDEFANATPITTAQGQATVDLGGATWEPGDPSGSSVWWKFTPGSSGRIRLRTCCAAGTSHIDSHTITLSLYRCSPGVVAPARTNSGSTTERHEPGVVRRDRWSHLLHRRRGRGQLGDPVLGARGRSSNSTADTAESVPWTASGSAEENNSSEEGGSPLWWSTVAQSTGSAHVFTASDGLGLEVYRRDGSGLLDLVAESNQYSGAPADVTFPVIAGTASSSLSAPATTTPAAAPSP